MSEGELVFKDGSFLKGSYRITQIKTGLKQLIFVTSDFSTDAFNKEADFLRSASGSVIATGLMKGHITFRGKTMTILCEFLG